MARLTDPWDIIRRQGDSKREFDLEQITDLYDGCVRNFDAEVQRIVAHLEACGLADNTIVVIYSDHGMEFFEHETWGQGNSVRSDFSARVPLIIVDPRLKGARTCPRVVRSIDVAPTLLDLLGIAAPHVSPEGGWRCYQAAYRALRPDIDTSLLEAGLAVELIPLDVTRRVVLAPAALTERLRRCPDDRIARFILDFTLHGFAFGASEEGGGIVLHDPLAMAVALDPSLVTFEAMSVEVECEGKLTRGLSLADRRALPSHRKRVPSCRVAMDVDADAVLRLFLERLCPASA